MYSAKARGGGFQLHGLDDRDVSERKPHSDPPTRRSA
jgi:hypothetical protein